MGPVQRPFSARRSRTYDESSVSKVYLTSSICDFSPNKCLDLYLSPLATLEQCYKISVVNYEEGSGMSVRPACLKQCIHVSDREVTHRVSEKGYRVELAWDFYSAKIPENESLL